MMAQEPLSRGEIRRRLQTLNRGGVRTAKIEGIKDAIQSGVYTDDKKLDIAIDRLLDHLNSLPEAA